MSGSPAAGWRAAARLGAIRLAYVAAVLAFGLTVAGYYDPIKGFSRLIEFGGQINRARLPALHRTNFHYQPDGDGYDAQYYVQIALSPGLGDPALLQAIDGPAYRARRILLSWTAYVFGGGKPEGILQAYAIQNAVAWLALAFVLLHWFPPVSWQNFLRWLGVLYACGMCVSVRNALIDGPSLLFIALGLALFERGRAGWATGVLALGGLTKETNLLGAAALVRPGERTWGGWGRTGLALLAVVLPLALWLGYIDFVLGRAADTGLRNFNEPFLSYFTRWRHTMAGLNASGWTELGAQTNLLMLVALTTQWLFLVLRPRWHEAWWRVGISYAVLMVVIGTAVWEGYPSAALRVLLPMQLAFNVLVPRTRRWLAVLVLGNLTMITAFTVLEPPSRDEMTMRGSTDFLVDREVGGQWTLTFKDGWHAVERSAADTWRWSSGSALAELVNPHRTDVAVRLEMRVKPLGLRRLTVKVGGREIWTGRLESDAVPIQADGLVLSPGGNRVEFVTDVPGLPAGGSDPRQLAFSVSEIVLAPATEAGR